ncbi:MAG TPA: hypothetical protein VLG50_06335 [Candidatus Saccharimonadales bacterium]|nr:hypothetical protein [Candidatus Saccharimonadales bacterium]
MKLSKEAQMGVIMSELYNQLIFILVMAAGSVVTTMKVSYFQNTQELKNL